MGPRSAPVASDPPLSRARQRVLDTLREHPGPMTLAELSVATSSHANTLREHLDALQDRGSVRRHAATVHGRGRPAWLYEAAPDGLDRDTSDGLETGTNAYAALATTLANALQRTSRDPRAAGVDAGRGWGRALAQGGVPSAERDDLKTRRRLVGLLGDLGFAPHAEAEARSVRLTRCPLLVAARRHPEVVCGVHLGIVQGALQAWGRPATDVSLVPFAEPGACRLLLGPNPPAGPEAPAPDPTDSTTTGP